MDEIMDNFKILVIHGPNLNLLGTRKPQVYGNQSVDEINAYIKKYFKTIDVDFYQSNLEGEIINKIHDAALKYDGIALNAAAYTHYSIAIRDAVEAVNIPVAEVHISNTASREEFRHKSVISAVVQGTVTGFGVYSYILAIQGLAHHLKRKM